MGARILVVDDSLTALMVISGVLERAGFEVIGARGGQEGLRAFGECLPDLVILDILMPELDGLEVCRRIRVLTGGREVPILFLTGDERPETQDQAIQAEGDDLILKQALERELVIRVRSLLRLRRLQQELKVERDALRESKQEREYFVRFIVHDLKSPLQTILLSTELLEEHLRVGESWGDLTRMIRDSGHTMTRMVQDLLDLEHSSTGQLALHVESVSLGSLVAGCAREMERLLSRHAQRLEVDIPEGAVWVGDGELLRRSMLNLLGNAAKYGPRGGRIDLDMTLLGGGLRVRVLDQGPGVPDAMKLRVFEPFVRLDRDVLQGRSSSGLGLAFCQAVTKAHGGRIWVEDQVPQGAAFCMELPSIPLP